MRAAAVLRVSVVVLAFLASGARWASANEVLIGSSTVSFSAGSRAAVDYRPFISFGFGFTGATDLTFIRDHLLFDDQLYSPADVGRTFIVTPSDPDFAISAAEMINGTNGRYYAHQLGMYHDPILNRLVAGGGEGGGGGTLPESAVLRGSFNPPDGVFDYKGHQVTEIRMRVDAIRIDIGPHTVGGTTYPTGRFDWGGTVTLTFFGPAAPVPAPGAASAGGMALGALVLGRWVRRRRRRAA